MQKVFTSNSPALVHVTDEFLYFSYNVNMVEFGRHTRLRT